MKYKVYRLNGTDVQFVASFRDFKYAIAEVNEQVRNGRRAWIKEEVL